jgi:hypothetical protein
MKKNSLGSPVWSGMIVWKYCANSRTPESCVRPGNGRTERTATTAVKVILVTAGTEAVEKIDGARFLVVVLLRIKQGQSGRGGGFTGRMSFWRQDPRDNSTRQ